MTSYFMHQTSVACPLILSKTRTHTPTHTQSGLSIHLRPIFHSMMNMCVWLSVTLGKTNGKKKSSPMHTCGISKIPNRPLPQEIWSSQRSGKKAKQIDPHHQNHLLHHFFKIIFLIFKMFWISRYSTTQRQDSRLCTIQHDNTICICQWVGALI